MSEIACFQQLSRAAGQTLSNLDVRRDSGDDCRSDYWSTSMIAHKISLTLRVGWLLLCIGLVVLFALTSNDTSHRDNDIVLGYLLIALAFPASLLSIWLMGWVTELPHLLFGANISIPGGWVGMVLTSPLIIVAGYLQWFVLIPKLWRFATASQRKRRLS